ncbi:MAG: hypothetical protein K5829_14805 [Treponema sp.]|nr:hypothetical protein [Treponema sp.]
MKKAKGYFTSLPGELGQFYKIENYDCMDDFFMTITSASDIWNFCWSKGGITAGRIDCDHAVFPYYTADKVSDAKSYTGAYTSILVEGTFLWEPFAALSASPVLRRSFEKNISHNIYKNASGTEVWFEEINEELKLAFRYGWTSSAKYGLVRKSVITNLSDKNVKLSILDGCRNILPACVTADFQNNNSVLLDAYKKTDLDSESNLAIFAVSSIVTDKAEPSEGLFANVCWFSGNEEILLATDAPEQFAEKGKVENISLVKGKRPAAYICKNLEIAGSSEDKESICWYQVFDTRLDAAKIAALKIELSDRTKITAELEKDIADGKKLMETYIAEADGFQDTAETMTCVHHSENVMFNIMRGGFFANKGKINLKDFVKSIEQRNKSLLGLAQKVIGKIKADKDGFVNYGELEAEVQKEMNPQLSRLFYEYMPLTFSRRHGDPSRPWNRFNINLRDKDGNPILNYEGNWRDIFQNWEALAWSYPQYIKNMTAKFLNAMTIEGFNPYRISREGIDWEIPDPDNPWAQIGYWGDHQVIYLQKLLEVYAKLNKEELVNALGEKIYASSNVPYRIKSYKEIVTDPRNTIFFDRELSSALKDYSSKNGSDAKLITADGKAASGEIALVTLATKLIQVVIAKMANFVPGGGIWLNTQRPEWNDANNALAGYGLSMVTLYYLHRFIEFLLKLFTESKEDTFKLPADVAECFSQLGKLYINTIPQKAACDEILRKSFTDQEGLLFEKERTNLYKKGYGNEEKSLEKKEIISYLQAILNHIKTTIALNKRDDGLYHAYNTMKINGQAKDGSGGKIQIEYLQEMLEGQVAALSAGLLKADEVLSLLKALRKSKMYEPRQNSYMLYPNKELAAFEDKNIADLGSIKPELLSSIQKKTGSSILYSDCNKKWHFNGEFRNVRFLKEFCENLPEDKKPDAAELAALEETYEKTFNHQSFTGRSGTFYAYEGLGSIYWHMVSKLLLAAQENTLAAIKNGESEELIKELTKAYYEIRSGIGFNKEAEIYGAFPADPYSHTPNGQGAKQPGMTGQVKEEILTRWGELGVDIVNGCANFKPEILKKSEFFEDGSLKFSWCGSSITYILVSSGSPKLSVDGIARTYNPKDGASLTASETANLFARNGKISKIEVEIVL